MKKILSLVLVLGILLCAAAIPAQAEIEKLPIVGDANGDNEVLIDDVTWIQRSLAGIPLPSSFSDAAADADEDCEVTILDATYVQRWMLGLDFHLNIGKEVFGWDFDETTAGYIQNQFYDVLTILRICPNTFYAISNYGSYCYKVTGKLSDTWCENDEIYVMLDNGRVSEDGYIAQADLIWIEPYIIDPDPHMCYKPVIYLYPEQETEVSVKLSLDGELMYTNPEYKDGWNVTAYPNGTLTGQDGAKYPYLYWDGRLNAEYDLSEGFCVKGEDTEAFLRSSLAQMGLNKKETDDFIDFWLRFMQDNPYNVISFQTGAYTDAAQLSISPQPDTTIRVFITWYASDEAVDIPAQELVSAERNGFTAVEWGGQKIR